MDAAHREAINIELTHILYDWKQEEDGDLVELVRRLNAAAARAKPNIRILWPRK